MAALLANPRRRDPRSRRWKRSSTGAEDIEALACAAGAARPICRHAPSARIAAFVGAALLEQPGGRSGLDEETRTHLNRRLRKRLRRATTAAMAPSPRRPRRWPSPFATASWTMNSSRTWRPRPGNADMVIVALGDFGAAAAADGAPHLSRRVRPSRWWRWSGMRSFSMRVAFKIQTFVMRLPAGELLPARDGMDFPLTEDEMRWHLSYFDIACFGRGPTSPSAETWAVKPGAPLTLVSAKPASVKAARRAALAALDLEFDVGDAEFVRPGDQRRRSLPSHAADRSFGCQRHR